MKHLLTTKKQEASEREREVFQDVQQFLCFFSLLASRRRIFRAQKFYVSFPTVVIFQSLSSSSKSVLIISKTSWGLR